MINKCRNAGIGSAHNGVSVLDSPVAQLIQMLRGRCAFAEPAVVCDVHHQAGSLSDGTSSFGSVNGFVADVWTPGIGLKNGAAFSGNKIALPDIHIVENREYIVKRQSFAEGN